MKQKVQKSCVLKTKKNISSDQKHSSQVARIYYHKNSLRHVAVDGQISMRKLLGGSCDTSDSLIKSMLFSEKSQSDISKASLREIKNDYCTDEEEEDDVESLIPCAQASPQKELKINHEETKVRESSDDKNSTASNTLKEFKNSERRTRVPFTPEEDSSICKGIKKHGLDTGRKFQDRLRTILEAVALLIVSRTEQKSYLANKNKFVYHKHLVHKLVNNHILKCSLNHEKFLHFFSM